MMAVPPLQSDSLPLYEIIYAVLRQHLIDGSLPTGLVLGEAGVARAFKSSRIPAAAALQRLSNEGLIRRFEGRGYLAVDADPRMIVRRELVDAGLRLPETGSGSLKTLNRQARIYPLVEHTVAALLSYGRFLVNESALAEHFVVSRTVAHEVLTRLERTGLIEKDTNSTLVRRSAHSRPASRAFRNALAARTRRTGAGNGELVAGRAPSEARAS